MVLRGFVDILLFAIAFHNIRENLCGEGGV